MLWLEQNEMPNSLQADQKVGAASAERYVRRRTRLMLQQQERLHQCRMVSRLCIAYKTGVHVRPRPCRHVLRVGCRRAG